MAGKSTFGGTVKLTGESEYQRALKGITSNLTVLSSEMKIVTSQYDKNDKSVSNLSQQNSVLTKKIEEQKSKVNILTQALEDSKKETGENSTTTKKWQTQLNNAQAELNKLDKQLDENTQGIKDFGRATDDAGESSSRLGDIIKGNLISDAIKNGIKALSDSMKSLGSAVINVGKSAIQSYAEYEQLVGGVETLFKDSANVVQNYANNAYKTAGLSANEYMETVTSFSASLLQSLDGDTAKSAEVADMAITDMSDNANKMGTTMEMLQNAYQGFAKQNYTMLDNLKLGYGGTKTEMERLLSDATAISGIKYDISNLNDVYNAIHVIQGELGITGTTAKEASTTIQGSLSAMQSAWKNLLTGVADKNADFSNLVNNFVDSVVTASENLLPRIEVAIEGIGLLVTDLLGLLLSKVVPMGVQMISNLIEGISSSLPDIISSISNAINVLVDGIREIIPQLLPIAGEIIYTLITSTLEMLPQILEMGIQLIVELANGLSQSLPMLIPVMIDSILTMVTTLLDNIDQIIDAGIQLILGLADGLITALPQLIEKIPIIIDKLLIAITDNLPKLLQMGVILLIKLAEGIVKSIPSLIAVTPKLMTSLLGAIGNYLGNMLSMGGELISRIKDGLSNGVEGIKNVGKNIVEGLWNGIKNMKDWVIKKIKGFGNDVLDGLKSFFGIHSPSTVMRDQVGKFLAQGIGVGFENEMSSVNKEIQNSLPTDFDLSTNLNLNNKTLSNLSNDNSNSYNSTVNAFKQALSEMKIMLDDEVAGNFVETRIGRVIYS